MYLSVNKFFKKALSKNEFYVFLIIIVICALIQIRSGQFFTPNNLVDILRSSIVPCMLGICVLLVMLSGGIDLSFAAIAALSMYLTNEFLTNTGYSGSIVLPFLIATVIGILCGFLNAIVISVFRLQTLIVTLGTASIFTGFLRGVFNAKEKVAADILIKFGDLTLFTAQNKTSGLTSNMPVTIFILLAIIVITHYILKKTILGRGIYAIGGSENAAVRAGFNTVLIKIFVYCYVGAIAGISGVTRASMTDTAHFTSLLGADMSTIAATVLGGASITGGIGTITGTILGTLLLTMVSNSLVMIGVPTYWQNFFTGLFIVVGTGFSVYQIRKKYTQTL